MSILILLLHSFSPDGALLTGAVFGLGSVSLETLLALMRAVSLLSGACWFVLLSPRRSAVSADRRVAVVLLTVASESLRAETEPSLVRRGCASMSMRDCAFLPDGGLEVELVVDTSDATETLSASARSVSDVSPSRALRNRYALVGRGCGRPACFARAVVLVLVCSVLLGFADLVDLLVSSLDCKRSSVEVKWPLVSERLEYISWSEDRMSEMANEEVWSSSVRSWDSWRPREEVCTERRVSERLSVVLVFVFLSRRSLALVVVFDVVLVLLFSL